MKEGKIPIFVSYNATPDELITDLYKRSALKIIEKSVRSVMGLVDAKLKKIDSLDFFVSFVDSLIINIFLRIGVFDLDKIQYLNYVEKFYNQYHFNLQRGEAQNIIDNNIVYKKGDVKYENRCKTQ